MLYYECIFINLAFLSLKSRKIKFEYKGFLRISESNNAQNYKLSIAIFSADNIKKMNNNKPKDFIKRIASAYKQFFPNISFLILLFSGFFVKDISLSQAFRNKTQPAKFYQIGSVILN